jgi:hypothetical protein
MAKKKSPRTKVPLIKLPFMGADGLGLTPDEEIRARAARAVRRAARDEAECAAFLAMLGLDAA